jgi:hypothetical protein
MAKKEKAGAATPAAPATKAETGQADKARRLFAAHPDVKRFYFTSDNQAFFQEGDARNHAGTLSDKTVGEVRNEKLIMDSQS